VTQIPRTHDPDPLFPSPMWVCVELGLEVWNLISEGEGN